MPSLVDVVVHILDSKNDTSRVLYHTVLDEEYEGLGGQSIDALHDYFQEIVDRLDSLIAGKITGFNIIIKGTLPAGIKAAPVAHSDVEEGADFVFGLAPNSAAFRHRIPSFHHSIFGNVSEINFDETADLAAYAMLLTQSSDAPDWADEYGKITDNRGVVVTSAPFVLKKFRKS